MSVDDDETHSTSLLYPASTASASSGSLRKVAPGEHGADARSCARGARALGAGSAEYVAECSASGAVGARRSTWSLSIPASESAGVASRYQRT